ncbi:Right handed beta helix region [Paenibacillus sp. yr247]|uniref:right-handed parallel beta-helix repeat-containing protein n=1 Tax=Paenibacillus sp. yr247 TaxID=1761880 RepID=UPI00087FAF30|nr:right-handed parallel beta-helix repeat-containing protein [Paenibacillus sp. yr247]SDN32416.1 Right handed beta helix region [Paenibacillus sp. yr247]
MSVNVINFGALPDGKSDSSSAFQKAIDSLPNGGMVEIPEGIFIIKNVRLTSNIKLIGKGGATVLKLPLTGKVWDMVLIVGGGKGAYNVSISDMVIDGNKSAIGLSDVQMHGIDVRGGSEDILIQKINFTNICGDGIRVSYDETSGLVPSKILIENCFFSRMGRQDIAVIHAYDSIISSCTGTGTLDIEPEGALVKRISIVGCIFTELNITADSMVEFADCTVAECIFQDSTIWYARGIQIGNSVVNHLRVSTAQDVILQNNSFKMLELFPTSDGNCSRISVIGNLIENLNNSASDPALSGFSNNPGVSLLLWNAQDCMIVNNIIRSENNAIYVSENCHRTVISGNKIDFTNGPLTKDAINQGGTLGIKLINSTTDLKITKNTVDGWYKAITANGAYHQKNLFIEGNTISNSVIKENAIEIYSSDSTMVRDNILYQDGGIAIYWGTVWVTKNHFYNTLASRILLSQCDASVGGNTALVMPEKLYNVFSSKVKYVGNELTVLKSPSGKQFQLIVGEDGKLSTKLM